MMQNTPPDNSDQAIVGWFAKAGLNVEVVVHCPDASCDDCGEALDQAA